MTERADSILRSPELASVLLDSWALKGMNATDVSSLSGVGASTIGRICHPEYPKSVSRRMFVRVVGASIDDPEQKRRILAMAGIGSLSLNIDPLAQRLSLLIEELRLNPRYQRSLEEIVSSHIKSVGLSLQELQKEEQALGHRLALSREIASQRAGAN